MTTNRRGSKIKTVFALLLGLSLSGCASLLGAPHPFDSQEYDLAVSASVAATRAVHQCLDRGPLYKGFVQDLNSVTMHLAEYEKFRPANQDSLQQANELRVLVLGLVARGDPSLRYCQHKLSTIQGGSRVLAMAFGGQAALASCGSDVAIRYDIYRESLTGGFITKPEFDELVTDLERLQEIDLHGCSLEAKVRLKQTLDAISRVAAFAGAL